MTLDLFDPVLRQAVIASPFFAASKEQLCQVFTATHCNTLQRTATYCNTLQHTATVSCLSYVQMTPMSGSCHTYERGMSHVWMTHVTHIPMNESCRMHERVKSYVWKGDAKCRQWFACYATTNHSIRAPMRHVTFESVMSQIWRSHVTRMNESCQMYQSSKVTCIKESCHTYEWVMSSNVTCMKESCHTYERVMSNASVTYTTCMKESCHTIRTDFLLSKNRCLTGINESCHVHESCHTYIRITPRDMPWLVSMWCHIKALLFVVLNDYMSSIRHQYVINTSSIRHVICAWIMSREWMSHVT